MTLEELADYEVERMDETEIGSFLSSHGVGVLALPTEGAPSMRPLSYWYDGDSALYLLYFGSEGRKAKLSDRATAARFLVYSTETAFNWRSVLLTGEIDEVTGREAERARESLEETDRPDVFGRALETADVTVYRFDVAEWSGIKSMGLPPAFQTEG